MFGNLGWGRLAAPLVVLPWGASAVTMSAAMRSAMELKHEEQIENVVSGDAEYSSVHSVIRQKKDAMSSDEAWENVDKDDELAMVQKTMKDQDQEKDSIKITEDTIDRARNRLNKMLTDAYKELDVVVIGCKNDYEMNRKEFSLADGDYTYSTAHKKHAKNLIEAANEKVGGYRTAQTNLKTKQEAAEAVFTAKEKALKGQIRAANAKLQVGLLILSVTGKLVKKHKMKHNMKGVPGNTRRRWKKKMSAGPNGPNGGLNLLQKASEDGAPVVSNLEVQACSRPDGSMTYNVNDAKIQARIDALQAEADAALSLSETAVLDEDAAVETELDELSFMQMSSKKKVAFATPSQAATGDSCCKAAGTHMGCPSGFFAAKNFDKNKPLNLCVSCTECANYTKAGAKWKPNKGDLTKWCRYKTGPTFFNQTPNLNMCPKNGQGSSRTGRTRTANKDRLPIDTVCTPARRAGVSQYGQMHDSMSRSIGEDSDKVFMLKRSLVKEQNAFKKKESLIKNDMTLQGELIKQEQEALREMDTQVQMLSKGQETADTQRKRLNTAKTKILDKCKKQIKELMQTTICGQLAVRDEVQNQSKKVKAFEIKDCTMGDKFEYGTCMKGSLAITCDDSRGHPGGLRDLKRINEEPNEYGFACPPSVFRVRCGRHGCPKDCVVPEFRRESYGPCNVNCGTGYKTAYRRPSVNPKNGGLGCPTLIDKKTCTKPQCDKDCKLGQWSPLSGCSQACGGGVRTQQRKILAQPVGSGSACPAGDSAARFRYKRGCNSTKCKGDEVCEARMDLVILLDASGSVGNENFFLMAAAVKELALKMNPKPLKNEGVRISVVRFGNGFIQKDGKNTPAEKIWPVGPKGFTGGKGMSDMKELGKMIQKAKFQRGFTNLAQGLLKAKDLFQHFSRYPNVNYRRILILTDGHASFREQAMVAKRAVEKQGITIQVVNFKMKYLKEMAKFASMPRRNNLLAYPSFSKINSVKGRQALVRKIVEKFCPKAKSPSVRRARMIKRGAKLVGNRQMCNGFPSQFVNLGKLAGCRVCKRTCKWVTVRGFLQTGQSTAKAKVQAKKTGNKRMKIAAKVKKVNKAALVATGSKAVATAGTQKWWRRRRANRRRKWRLRNVLARWRARMRRLRALRRARRARRRSRRVKRCYTHCTAGRCQHFKQCTAAARKHGLCHFQMAIGGRWKGSCLAWSKDGKKAPKPGTCPCPPKNKARGLCKWRPGTSWTKSPRWKVYQAYGGKCI